jgi:hypothetical protein
MYLLNKIKPLWFFMAFAIGVAVCYVFTPPLQVVVRFPSPSNAGKFVYTDADSNCYTYKSDVVACSKDSKDQPISQQQLA